MGILLSRVPLWGLFDHFFPRETRVLMLGLDAAGKTSILYRLKLDELLTTVPTIGFNVESTRHRNLEMTLWDVGGQDKIRQLWKHYYRSTDALIFVVDSSDSERLEEARDELHATLAHPQMADQIVLIYANKVDLPGSLTTGRIIEGLQLQALTSSRWHVQHSSAATGIGILEGLRWLSERITARRAAV